MILQTTDKEREKRALQAFMQRSWNFLPLEFCIKLFGKGYDWKLEKSLGLT